ncbi:MAG: hypothetical protein ACFFE5_13500 [Candidatus Thorarchaeota archaeon]
MVLYQLESLTRVLTIYLVQGLICAWFLYLAYRILKRDRKRLNIIFSGVYLSAAIGLIFNFIYGPIADPTAVLLLNYLTNFGSFYAPIFFVVFNLILLKSEKIVTPTKQLMIFIGYGIYMACMIFFVLAEPVWGILGWGVTLDASTGWAPVWATPFFLYVFLGVTVIAIIPLLFLSFQIYKKFEDKQLKKKWKFVIYGSIGLIGFMYAIFFSNWLNIDIVRMIVLPIGIVLAAISGYWMYSGVGRQLEK